MNKIRQDQSRPLFELLLCLSVEGQTTGEPSCILHPAAGDELRQRMDGTFTRLINAQQMT